MRVLFLTVAGSQGNGHLSRCIAISYYLKTINLESYFIVDTKNNLIKKKYTILKWYNDFDKLTPYIKKYKNVFVDALNINKNIFLNIENLSKNCFYINDFKNWNLNKTIAFNWTIGARSNNPNYFYNEKFTALRPEFFYQKKKKINKSINSILIFFGSRDDRNISEKVLEILFKLETKSKINLIINQNKIKYFINKYKKIKNLNIYSNLSAYHLRKILIKSDIAIAAGGVFLYELANTGTPTIGILIEKNHKGDIEGWSKKKFILKINKSQLSNSKILENLNKINSKKIRTKMSAIGQQYIDGKGGLRIAKIISKVLNNV